MWLPAAIAVIGVAVHAAALPAGAAGWAYLAAGGLPLGLAWCLLSPVRSIGVRTAFSLLAPLSILWCVLASGAGPAVQVWGAAALSLPVWFLFVVPRRGRRNVVSIENTVWRIGLVTR